MTDPQGQAATVIPSGGGDLEMRLANPPPSGAAAGQDARPARIYLQHDVEDEGHPFPKDWNTDEVTWCTDRIAESDIEYVRADLCLTMAQKMSEYGRGYKDGQSAALTRTPSPSEAQPVEDWTPSVDAAPMLLRDYAACIWPEFPTAARLMQVAADHLEAAHPAPSPSEGVREAELRAAVEDIIGHWDEHFACANFGLLIERARAALASSTVEETKRGEG